MQAPNMPTPPPPSPKSKWTRFRENFSKLSPAPWIWKKVLGANPLCLCVAPIIIAIILTIAARKIDLGLPSMNGRMLAGPLASLMLAHAAVFAWMHDTGHPVCPYKNRDILGFHKVFCLALGCMVAGEISELFGSSYATLMFFGIEIFLLGMMYWEYYCVDRNISSLLTGYLTDTILLPPPLHGTDSFDKIVMHFSRIADTAISNSRNKPVAEQAESLADALLDTIKHVKSINNDPFSQPLLWMRVGERCLLRDPSPREIDNLSLLAFANSLCQQLVERGDVQSIQQMLCVVAGVISTITRWTSSMMLEREHIRVMMRYQALVRTYFQGAYKVLEQNAASLQECIALVSSALFQWILSDYVAQYHIKISGTGRGGFSSSYEKTHLKSILDEQFAQEHWRDIKEPALKNCHDILQAWKSNASLPGVEKLFACDLEELYAQTKARMHYGQLMTFTFEKENIAQAQLPKISEMLTGGDLKPSERNYV